MNQCRITREKVKECPEAIWGVCEGCNIEGEACPYCGEEMDSIEEENGICWNCRQDQIDLMDEEDLKNVRRV